MSKERQIEEMARDIFAPKVAIDGIDIAFAAVHGADKPDSHFMRIAQHLYNAGYRKQEWISVDERLPDREGAYLVLIVDYLGEKRMEVMELFKWANCFDWSAHISSRWEDNNTITHWMPLPEAPEMKGGE